MVGKTRREGSAPLASRRVASPPESGARTFISLPPHNPSPKLETTFVSDSNLPDLQEMNVDDLQETQKGLFQRRLSLLRGRKRRSSIGTMSSKSDSFRTVTPLSSERGEASDEGSEGKRRHSAVKTSTPKDANRKASRGTVQL